MDERHSIKAWSWRGVLLESYRYAPGPAEALPKHSHEEYQLGLSLDFPGLYEYRGARHAVPVGSLSVIHPGEVHSTRDPQDRRTPASYRMMYVAPDLLREAATQVAGRDKGPPFVEDPIVLDGDLSRAFLGLHLALEGPTSRLEQDSRLLCVLALLVERHANVGRPQPVGRERRAVRLAREYIEDNHARSVPLEDLARLANLSPFHLTRVFREEVGLPPHAYQTQVRLAHAKRLLVRGWPVARVARQTGFADRATSPAASSASSAFRRGATREPRGGENSKNVQDRPG